MTRTVSARIPNQLHEEIRERCNKVGCSINDYLQASLEFALNDYSEFDFGNEDDEPIAEVKEARIVEIRD